MKLRAYLAVLVLAGAIPVVVLAVAVTATLVAQQRAAVDRGLSDTVDALAAAIENDVETSIKSLETLATVPSLDRHDLPAFYAHAGRVRDLQGWSTIGLIDTTGQHRLNLARPFGASLPDLSDREYFKQVVATGRPYVSDLLHGRATSTVDIAMAVPVIRDGRLQYVLFAGVDPARFSAVFARQALPADAVASLLSRDGVMLARSRDHAGALGRPLPADYVRRVREAPSGRLRRVTFDGIEFESAYRPVARTGWTVDFGMAAEVVNGPVRRIAWLAGLVGLGIVAGAVALAVVVARRMAGDIDVLASATAALGGGAPAPAGRPLRVAELEAMRRSVIHADDVLRERERQRADVLAREHLARREAEHLAGLLRQVQLVTEAPLREASAERLMHALLASIRSALGSDTATILLVTPDGGHLTPVSSDGLRDAVVEEVKVPVGHGIAGRIVLSEGGLIVPDLAEIDGVVSTFLRDRVKSLMGAPLRVGARLVGVIHVGASAPHHFTEDDLRLLNLVADRVAVVIELTRLHEAERAARAEAEAASTAKDQFLAMLSHELRSPLTAITGWVRMVRKKLDDPAFVVQGIEVIERNADLQVRLVDDLLDVSRVASGKLALDRRPVDLGRLVLAAVETLRPAATARRIRLDAYIEAAAVVHGDAARLQQIVGNLLGNSIKFTPEQGRVTVRVDRSATEALITVADTGHGIRAEFLPHVFEAFRQQADAFTNRVAGSGVGLGLAIVRHLVVAHGGTIAAASDGEGLGATFTVRLPLHETAGTA